MDILSLPRSVNEAINFLQYRNVLKKITCCGHNCHIQNEKNNSDGCIYKCLRCSKKHSIRKGSFFSGSNLTLVTLLHIVYFFSSKVNVTSATKLLKYSVSGTSIKQWYSLLRDICSMYLIQNDFELGGPGPVFVT